MQCVLGARYDLGRPTITAIENKRNFKNYLLRCSIKNIVQNEGEVMDKRKLRNEQILAQYKDQKEISLEELKKIAFEMLKYLDTVCKENNIKYFLFAGTALGAVRHGGFIPWDDDIDVILFRDDYNRLIDILHKKDSKYNILSNRIQDDYFYFHSKLVDTKTILVETPVPYITDLGVFLDIFPLDYLPNNAVERKRIKRKFRFYSFLKFSALQLENISKTFVKKIAHDLAKPICRVIGWKYFDKKLKSILKTLNAEKTEYAESLVGGIFSNRNIKASWFDSQKMMMFEGQEFPVPAEYDKWLHEIYGDYMKLPPEEERVTHHSFKAYYKR